MSNFNNPQNPQKKGKESQNNPQKNPPSQNLKNPLQGQGKDKKQKY